MPSIAALATASPDYVIPQALARDYAARIFADRPGLFQRMAGVFDNAGIDTRRSCVPPDWYLEPHGWPDRNGLYVRHALDLLQTAARQCLDNAGVAAAAIDAVVAVSSTGVATPSLDARLMERLPFRRDVMRLPVFGLGCAGGVLGLARAAALAQAMPGARILLLVVELCGLAFRRRDVRKNNIVATALFGDGAAAVLLEADTTGGGGPVLRAWGEHTWPDSLDVMGWSVEDDGLGVIFSRDIPTIVRTDMRAAADAFLARHTLTAADLDGMICHPGGTKVLAAIEDSFNLGDGALAAERAVLRRFGNMSAPTVLFVLAEKMAAGARGRHLMTALGPGFSVGFLLLDL